MAKITGALELFTEGGDPVNVKNTYLLDYLLWDFSWNVESAVVGEHIETKFPKFKDRPELAFKLEKTSSTEFTVELKRRNTEKDIPPDDGYFLEFIITLFGYKGSTKRRIMDFENDSVSVVYKYHKMCDLKKESGYWVMKCIVKMHEVSLLQNEARTKQEELILNLANKQKYREKFADMAYLLERESLEDIFSGRQTYEFAVEKAGLIERTLIFADDLADKMRAKENDTEYETSTSIGAYLNYILRNSLRCIDKYSALKLYIMAHNYGLLYIAEECAEYFLNHIDNEYLVHILVYADMAQDTIVLNLALDLFIMRREDIMQTKAWKKMLDGSRLFAQNIIDLSIRKIQQEIREGTKELNDNRNGDEQQESAHEESQSRNGNANQTAAGNSKKVNEEESRSSENGTEDKVLPKTAADTI